MNKARKKIQAVIFLILFFIMLDPSVIGLLKGKEFIFSVNNILAIVAFVAAVIIYFVPTKK